MSNTNTNVRSLRDKFHHQQDNQYGNVTKNRQDQKHDISFQCIHCGRHQTVTLLLQSNITNENVRLPSREYDSNISSKNTEQTSFSPENIEQANFSSRNLGQNNSSKSFGQEKISSKNIGQASFSSQTSEQENFSSETYGQESNPSKKFEHANFSSKNFEQENKSFALFRPVSIISEEQDELTPPLQRSNYSLDFHHANDKNTTSKTAVEQNVKGFIDGCVRSSLHEISHVNREPNTQDIVELEVEYDPILGNVKSTRKRSSTIITSLDNDHRSTTYRHQSLNSRYKVLPITDSERDTTPIWARRRVSQSTVKPSDLVREYDKKEKLESTALRRLSRADLAGNDVIPNSTIKPMISAHNPTTIKDTILRWCQDLTQFYKGVNIRNFSSSWSDGLAFCAIIHRYFPDEFNYDTLNANEARQNLDLAFTIAFERAGIEPLIDTDDMILMGNKPDWKVVFTYVQSLYRHLSRIQPPAIMRERW